MPLFFDKGNISDIRFGFFMTKINAVYWKENGNARNERTNQLKLKTLMISISYPSLNIKLPDRPHGQVPLSVLFPTFRVDILHRYILILTMLRKILL